VATIDQLRMMASGKTQSLEKGQTARDSAGNFKKVLKSVMEVPKDMESFFTEASRTYGVSKKLLKAVAKAESNYNPAATSPKGAAGVMQLMPATARSLGVSDPYDARSNIMGGAKYLRENLDKYNGDVTLTLAAYNAGSNNVKKYGGVPPFKETQEYVKKIMRDMGVSDGIDDTAVYASGYSGNSVSDLSSYFSDQDSLNSYGSQWMDILKSIAGNADGTDVDLASQKTSSLYLIELMKLRMQMASSGVSGQFDVNDSGSGSLL
jgi:hypothetical protein